LIENKTAKFDAVEFTDRYQAALLEVIKFRTGSSRTSSRTSSNSASRIPGFDEVRR